MPGVSEAQQLEMAIAASNEQAAMVSGGLAAQSPQAHTVQLSDQIAQLIAVQIQVSSLLWCTSELSFASMCVLANKLKCSHIRRRHSSSSFRPHVRLDAVNMQLAALFPVQSPLTVEAAARK